MTVRAAAVGWAGGGAGPDFFIYTVPPGSCPAVHWSHDHTVFAQVDLDDAASWQAIMDIDKLPVRRGGMTMLVQPLKLTLS